MYFFDKNEAYRDNIFCIDEAGASYTYRQIWELGDTAAASVPQRSLVLLLCGNNVRSLSVYLALLRRRCPVILMGEHTDQALIDRMTAAYRPAFTADGEGIRPCSSDPVSLHPDLALLLSTSGSTGAQKLVRLSYDNLQANCDSIVEYLGLTPQERPITTLPMEYTYGLSVLHSHAAVGASIILTDRTMFEPAFWDLVAQHQATSMAGVPYTYEILHRLRIQRMDLPSVRTLTQAGGHLKADLQEALAKWAGETGRRFFVMYGQTEATARMSYIPCDRCRDKIGSIGVPVPGGSIELVDEDGSIIEETGISGELIYRGANVSLGYALCREDLARGDENRGRLATGDMAYRDAEGYYFITGRKKRFVKLYGKRISLDQVQDDLQETFSHPDLVCTGDDARGIRVWLSRSALEEMDPGCSGPAEDPARPVSLENLSPAVWDRILQEFWDRWGIRENMVSAWCIPEIPRNASGKTIYASLSRDS